jgi:tetratricopeptide (TPR) repeat protein
MYAAISPRDCAAGLLCDRGGGVQLLDRAGVAATSISVERYLSRHPDTSVVEVRDGKHTVNVLAERATMSMCLDMTLLLFDRDVSVQTRQELALELDRLLQDVNNKNYVLDVVLCSPLSTMADVDGAVNAVESANIVRDVVASILRCQRNVRLIVESWLMVKQEPIVQQAGAERVFALLSRHGVFRRLALEAADTAQLDAIKPALAMHADLNAQFDAAPRVVLNLVNELSKKLPAGTASKPTIRGQADIDVRESEWQGDDAAKPQHTSVHAAYSAAVSQVDEIVRLYTRMKDSQAEAILRELMAEQAKYPGGEQHLVKSLCNIAVKVDARGRPEIGLNCLREALTFPGGIDSQLYLQIGTELRKLRRFDEALNCYEHARQLDDGSLSDRIRLAMIRVTEARGSYQEALSGYLEIPDLDCQPNKLFRLGTLYRKMGLRREAREKYHRCLRIDEEFHRAYAGLAEIRKQTGKPHQAIAEYNAIIRRFTDLDVGSKKVYDLARSHLFRLTQQHDKSERILRDLVNTFPADRDVHLQFAKLLALQGDLNQAREHFEKAKRPSLQDLGELVFAKASKIFDSAIVRDGLASIQTSLMPEEKGLASCIEAYDLITNSDFERAQQVLQDPKFVDRLVGDFASVLRFHALRKTSSGFDYKSDHSLCRVAKRSDHSLRCAMRSIVSGDYDIADKLESEFLLRLVA